MPRPFLERNGFAVLACGACGLRFLHPQPAAEQLTALYGPDYFANAAPGAPGYDRYVEEMANIRRTFDNRLRLLPRPAPGARLLDVGAAIGLFVERARAAGWDAEGLEPSRWASGYARDILHQPVREGILDAAAVPAGSCAVVTMWEVIEHLPDPAATLGAAARALAPGGLLALSTPDAGSTVARILGQRWPGWTKIPEHLFFFDRATLRRLLETAGFRVEAMRYVSLTVSRRYLLDRIEAVTGSGVRHRLPGAWLDRPVRVNPLYDLMVLARTP
jgi:2-polyprenyl-3-methyl-5-hydroxy-6-metoxy-1,4-benzoquinol methylase